jgi:hypothetical protein
MRDFRRVFVGNIVPCEATEDVAVICPLSVEPTKPRLILDARFVNLWTRESPFSLHSIHSVLPWVGESAAKADMKSGYFHLQLALGSRRYFCFRWRGATCSYTVLCFGWKASPYVLQTLMGAHCAG